MDAVVRGSGKPLAATALRAVATPGGDRGTFLPEKLSCLWLRRYNLLWVHASKFLKPGQLEAGVLIPYENTSVNGVIPNPAQGTSAPLPENGNWPESLLPRVGSTSHLRAGNPGTGSPLCPYFTLLTYL